MADAQVTCIRKNGTTHETITHLGGAGWQWTKEAVIASIQAGTNTFYTYQGGKRADVRVVESTPPYLQTVADGRWTNNLLALPTCTPQ